MGKPHPTPMWSLSTLIQDLEVKAIYQPTSSTFPEKPKKQHGMELLFQHPCIIGV